MIKLLSAILAHLPRLPGASCIGKHRMYDPVLGNGHQHRDQERARLAEAARVCAGCRWEAHLHSWVESVLDPLII
jgi:hypothetical protein